jgi:hypothetical protein
VRKLTPVLWPIDYPDGAYAEGLYMGRDGDAFTVWAEVPDGSGWRVQGACEVTAMPIENMSEQLRRQHVRMSRVDVVV